MHRCLILFTLLTLWLNAARAQDVYREPPLGFLFYAPYVLIEGQACRIVHFDRDIPIALVREGETQRVRGKPKYLFLPSGSAYPAGIKRERSVHLSANTNSLEFEIEVDREVEDLFYFVITTDNQSGDEFWINGYDLGDAQPDKMLAFRAKAGRMGDDFSGNRIYTCVTYFKDGLPLYQQYSTQALHLFKQSSDAFFRALLAEYLETQQGQTRPMKLVHAPLPGLPPEVRDELEPRRLVFKVTFDDKGEVTQVEPQDQTGVPHAQTSAAIQALFGWRCLPPREDGQPTGYSVLVPIKI
ncbi:MAG: hypothetical protein Q7P63_09670 [Verrucomicrobiota bacterium JB022]|nr:hypothetical protein [Verrucomicrobiota bacterium JB022]